LVFLTPEKNTCLRGYDLGIREEKICYSYISEQISDALAVTVAMIPYIYVQNCENTKQCYSIQPKAWSPKFGVPNVADLESGKKPLDYKRFTQLGNVGKLHGIPNHQS